MNAIVAQKDTISPDDLKRLNDAGFLVVESAKPQNLTILNNSPIVERALVNVARILILGQHRFSPPLPQSAMCQLFVEELMALSPTKGAK